MLSRSAQGLYWMGRYLERTRHLCRLLELQTAALVDRPVREIYFGWRRIYSSVGRHPTGGSLEIGDDDYTLADSYTLADDLTFEPLNPSSIWSCLALGRENARQMRHCISAEMWTSLNLFYLRVQRLGIKDIWRVSPESFYTETSAEINTFSGIASTTMYRDDGWRFMQFGHLIERAQLSAALLTAHLAAETTTKEDSADDWTSLLRAYRAFEAYNRRYSIEVHPDRVLELLVADPMLPSSLCQSIDAASAELAGVAPGPDTGSSAAARRLVSRIGARVHDFWPDREDHGDFLRHAAPGPHYVCTFQQLQRLFECVHVFDEPGSGDDGVLPGPAAGHEAACHRRDVRVVAPRGEPYVVPGRGQDDAPCGIGAQPPIMGVEKLQPGMSLALLPR